MRNKERSILCMAGLALLFTVTACSPDQKNLTGVWHTEFEAVPNLQSSLDFELKHDLFGDKWNGKFEITEAMVEAPLEEISVKDSKIELNLGQGAKFEGKLSDDKTVIKGTLSVPNRKPETLNFTKIDKWSSQRPARVDKNNQFVEKWKYEPPALTDDGWKVGTMQKDSLNSKPFQDLFQRILHGNYQGLDALLVAKDGKLVLEEYFYLGDRDKIHMMQSATKSVNSLLLGIAHDNGLIKNLDAPLKSFFPAYSDSTKTNAAAPTLRQALNMSAGLDWKEDIPYTDPKNDAVQMNQSKDMYQYVLSKKPDAKDKPGEKFEYNSGLSILLGGVILNVTKKPADKYAEQTLFNDLGIKKYTWTQANGQVHTGGGLYMQPRDMMKIGQLVLDKGKWNGKQIVSETWITESTAFHLPLSEANKDWGYGYQWWRGIFLIDKKIYPAIYAAGYGGQLLYIVPDLNLVVLTLHHNATDIKGSHSITWKEAGEVIIPVFK